MVMQSIDIKLDQIKTSLKEMGSVLIAYSGGVDSTLLIKVAYNVLGEENVLAVTAKSPLYPASELELAKDTATELGIRHLIIESNELEIDGFAENPKNRCYLCKKRLFEELSQISVEYGLRYILDGSNASDTNDFRPGRQANREFGVRSVLEEVGLTKDEVRQLSERLGLATYNKPSAACLASRFPYGKQITLQSLNIIDKAEEYLKGLGISQVRVRHYENLCRIEIDKQQQHICLKNQDAIVTRFKELGYTYITLDMEGYRTGSMNSEIIND